MSKRRIVEGGKQDNKYVIPPKTPRIYLPRYVGALGMGSSTSAAYRDRVVKINTEIQRRVVDQVPLIQSIINVRADQIRPFTQRMVKGQRRGFKIVPVDSTVDEVEVQDDIDALSDFFEHCGFHSDPDREDDFQDYCQMLVREVFTVDQVATEIQYNRRGNPIAFWLLDGTTIKRLDPTTEEYRRKYEGYTYAQDIEDKIYNLYTHDTLIFDYQYKRADIRYRGYGYSPVEQCIDLITTLLFGHAFSRDQFVKNQVPQGFISVMGDVGQDQIDAIRENWIATMEGQGGQFAIPIVPSGKDGVGIDFKALGQKNREMEYAKLMHFLVSLICAVFAIDPAELGIKSDDSNNLAEASLDTRQGSSRDRGLTSVLSFIERICNKILQRITPDYQFKFQGHDLDEESKRAELAKKRMEAYTTVDEEREAEGLEPFEESWSRMVANPSLIQMRQSEEAMQQQQGGEEGEEAYGEGGEEEEVIDPDELEQELGDVQKSYRQFQRLSIG